MSLLFLYGVQPVADFIILGTCQVVRILLSIPRGYFLIDLRLRDPAVLSFAVHAGELGVCEGPLSARVPVLGVSGLPSGIFITGGIWRRCGAIWGRWRCGAAVVVQVWIVVPPDLCRTFQKDSI